MTNDTVADWQQAPGPRAGRGRVLAEVVAAQPAADEDAVARLRQVQLGDQVLQLTDEQAYGPEVGAAFGELGRTAVATAFLANLRRPCDQASMP